MATDYRCPDCGQVVPWLGLDDGPPAHCPNCQGATHAGPPPVPPPQVPPPETIRVKPLPLATEVPLARVAPDEAEVEPIDIRRRDVLPRAPVASSPKTGGRRHYWVIVVAIFLAMRGCSMIVNHRPAARQAPPPPVVQFPQNPGPVQPPR
jgi:hypothetical protein